jgi:DNA-binding SARP family transcriptional activator
MRKPPIVYLFSHLQEKQFEEILKQDFTIITFPLNQAIERERLRQEPSLAIVCDASEEENGISRIEEIKACFPDLPLILIAEDPSKAYLLAALKHKISNYLTLQSVNEELRKAALQLVKVPQIFGKLGSFWKRLFTNKQENSAALTPSKEPVLEQQNPILPEYFDEKIPSFLHFPPKNGQGFNSVYDVSVQFFGNLNIDVREKPKPRIIGEKNTTILAYLLFHHHRSTHREILMEQFWGDFTPSSAKNSLNVAICSIRKNLSKTFPNQEVIVFDNHSYGINPELKVITDTENFIHHWKKGSTIEASQGLVPALVDYNQALSYYKEEFLSNLRFEGWCEHERDNLKEVYLFILNKLGGYFFNQKEYDNCINIGKKMLKEDVCLEEVHRVLMKSYYLIGQPDLAHLQFFKCKKALKEELESAPSELTIDLFNKIQNGRPIC